MKKNQFNITVCENPKFIWFRNAKVATRSIKWVIDQQFETQEFYAKNIKPYDLSEYFTFGLVRNPYTRIISAYFNKMVRLFKQEKSEIKEKHLKYLEPFTSYEKISPAKGFKILLDQLSTSDSTLFRNIHFTPQSNLIDSDKLDFLGKFENLKEDTAYIFKKIGVPAQLPHRNKSKYSFFDRTKFLDQENRKIIEELYQQDFELFNYPKYV
jgi:hypothetical protein